MWRRTCLFLLSPGFRRQSQNVVRHTCLFRAQYGISVRLSEGTPLRLLNTSTSVPVWQCLVESIQELAEKADDVESWWRFCRLWRMHFPQAAADSLPLLLENELLVHDEQNETGKQEKESNIMERVPRDLQCLPVFLQALCTAVQLGETRLQLSFPTTKDDASTEGSAMLVSVLAELRVVVFYLAQERLTHTLYAVHDRLSETTHAKNENSRKDIVLSAASSSSRDGERVGQMGVRLTPEELQQALLLADASAAVLSIGPPVTLLPSLYRLLLPALGACEQLENHRLGALAIAVARSADFDDPNGDKDNFSSTTATAVDCPSSGDLRPIMTCYTVLSHLHAVARALEVRMRESMQRFESKGMKPTGTSIRQAQLRLLSLKERKDLEKQRELESESVGSDATGTKLLETVGIVCSALAARRYTDDRFWKAVTDYTVASLQASANSFPTSTSYPHLLEDVRNILFALDHVHHKAYFDCVMSLLVKLHLLQEPIPPPSAVRNAMKAVKGQTAATLGR
ncbi:hypothetical protein C4B63_8g51 [Trypanosoma cruzi]|uniref:Uncharacterized protein n=1 Tax=Trypanosoma cruzi TaxID=5693 RepID=A0A2V2VTM4_TRYCR|nr:hypothetical protein C4B63_8g51 [Trypanosoma cruzi]